ncbi:hypothetical protein Plhal304r1_c001g0004021 [Plasmopara halstedii]
MSTCLALAMLSSDFNCLMAAWLSMCMCMGSETTWCSSRTSSRSPSSSRPTWEADVNSASMVDSDTPVCFLHTQWTIAPSIVTTPPLSTWTRRPSDAPTSMRSLRVLVFFKYRAIRFANFQSLIRGWCVCLVALCTAKLMSGLVHRAIQRKLPTSDWKLRIVGSLLALTLGSSCSSWGSASLASSPMGVLTPFASASPNCSSSSSMAACWSRL